MSTPHSLPRRTLLQLAGSSLLLHGSAGQTSHGAAPETLQSWKMGLIADLHYGLAPDALPRLEQFMQAVESDAPDCILQLGDFNFGVDATDCMDLWQQFPGAKYHVLGNHDMDKVTKQEIVDQWEMPNNFYSFDHRGWHFIVLDRNHLRPHPASYIDYGKANFYVDSQLRGFADPEQLDWLREDLERTSLPTVVFAHQGLGMEASLAPESASGAIESILEAAKTDSGAKVKACFCGHHHLDRYQLRGGIHYVWINSASYYWVGNAYGRMAAYTDPLYTFLTFRSDQSIEIRGSQSTWASPSPQERGFPKWSELGTEIVERRLG